MQFPVSCSHFLLLTLKNVYRRPILKTTELTPSLIVTDQVLHPYKTRGRTIAVRYRNARPHEVLKNKNLTVQQLLFFTEFNALY
jgi:hypothetical protein